MYELGTKVLQKAFSSSSQRKKPALPRPSTMIIMPAINRIVDQLMPAVLSSLAPYQNVLWKNAPRLSVSQMALIERMQTPNTSTSTSAPLPSVM